MRQLPLITPDSSWRPVADFRSLQGEPIIALDTETRDPSLKTEGPGWPWRGGEIVGFSLATPNWARYYPIRHKEGDNLPDARRALAWLRSELARFEGVIVVMNALYDFGWLRTENIVPGPNAKIRDVAWVEALLDENKFSYSLDSIAKTYNLELKDSLLLKEAAAAWGFSDDVKGNLWQLPGRYVGMYGERDAQLPLQIWERQRPLVVEQGLEQVVELEHDLLPLLLNMRQNGVRVDLDRAEQAKKKFLKRHQEAIDEIARISGHRIGSVSAAADVAKAFDRVGVPYPLTSTGMPSFQKGWLERADHPISKQVVIARRYLKAANDFCGAMLLNRHKNGRIHCQFHPLRSDEGGAVSGRFASSDPNLQQVPARDPEIGPAIRSALLPEHGEFWCASDYSQQEPRLTVHYANIMGLPGAAEAAARYTNDPSMDYHNMMAEITGLPRKQAKNIFLGLCYGEGGAKLCQELGLPTIWKESRSGARYETAGPEGQAVLDTFDQRAPFVRKLSAACSETAARRGYIKTLSGRRSRFELWEPIRGGRIPGTPKAKAIDRFGEDNIRRAYTHKALNRIIQGGSADMIKYALRELYREKLNVLVTVHDENGLSVPDAKTARRVGEIMQHCVSLSVPFKCDVDLGPSWGEAKPLGGEDA